MLAFPSHLCALVLSALTLSFEAEAGAFLLVEGQGQFIAGVGYAEGSRRFDPSGRAIVAPSFRKAEASGYLEYGLTSWLSLIAAPTLAHAHDATATNAVTGSDSSALGARLQLYGAPGRVIALQVLVQPPIGADRLGADVRLMGGLGFAMFGLPAFVDVAPGAHLRTAPLPTEARLDLTFGIRPKPNVLALFQDFSSIAPAAGPTIPRSSNSKLQASLVYDVSATWSAQIGVVRTIAGRNAVRETGPLGAIWYRF